MNYLRSHVALTAIVALAIVAVAGSVLMVVYNGSQTNKGGQVQQEQAPVTKTEVPINTVPDQFPKDVPIETGAKITQNYNATAQDGTIQATRTFETTKTLDANLKIYQDYLKSSGWKIEATVDQPEYKMLFASNGTSTIQIAMNENAVAKVKTVDISYSNKANVLGNSQTTPQK